MKKLLKSLVAIAFIGILAVIHPGNSANAAADDFTVKVQLKNNLGTSSIYHFVPKGNSVLKEKSDISLVKGKKYTIQVVDKKLTLKEGSKVLASKLESVTVEPQKYAKENFILIYKGSSAAEYPYMGTVLFRLSGTTAIQPVNSLQFEDYLKGVVPAESPAGWGTPANKGMEALKAQAIAARSYVFSKMNQNTLEIDDTTNYQVYKGFIWDSLSPDYSYLYQYTNQAVDETKGQILTYKKSNGQDGFVTAFFSSSNGGQTELAEQYWANPLPYVTKSQPDPYDTKNVTWELTWLKQQLSSNLDLALPASWWDKEKENNLDSGSVSNAQSRTAFSNFKNYALKELKKKDTSIESIKIASIDKMQKKDYSNTKKVSEMTIDVSYYTQFKKAGLLSYDMVAGAASETLSGTSRYDTAVEIAKAYVGSEKAKTIVFGRGDVPADALSGTVLAHKHNAPIMLIRNDSIPAGVDEFLKKNTASDATIYLLGGTIAISKDVESELQSRGYNTIRLSGQDRTGTSIAIAEEVGSFGKVLFATGNDESSDALSASAYAAAKQIPIIIHRGSKTAAQTKAFLNENGTDAVTLIGGSTVIPTEVETELQASGLAVERISGKSRVDTSIAINQKLPLNGENIVIGNAYSFIDALAGSVLAAKTESPIVMLHPDSDKLPTDFFRSLPVKNQAYFLGGSMVVTDSLKNAVNDYIAGALKKNTASFTFSGSKLVNGVPTMSTFRTTLGAANLKSTDFDVLNQSGKYIMDGSGFGHGIGLSQWGSYKRAQADHSAQEILKFYFQGVTIKSTQDYVN